jgi:4-aminobutyrate aminotransferase
MGKYILERLQGWPEKLPNVGNVRGRGLMIGIELVKDQASREPHPQMRRRVIQRAFELGLLVLGCGESTVRLMPPLVVEQYQADFALDVLERVIEESSK